VNPWQQASSLARREWLLCLQAGDVPGEGWIRALDRFLAAALRDGGPMGRFARKGGAGQALSRVTAAVAGTRIVRPGDIVRRDWLTAEDRRRVQPLPIAASIERDSFR
jgi:hypothetical protein